MAVSHVLLTTFLVVTLQRVCCQDLRWLSLQVERLNSLERSDWNVLNTHNGKMEDFDLHSELEDALQDLWTENSLEIWQDFHELSGGCRKSAKSIVSKPINSSWLSVLDKVLPLLDASGKPGAGILDGNFILEGAYDECFSYNYTAFCYATEITLTNITLYPPMIIGLCVPKHCNSKDLTILLNSIYEFQVSESTVYCDDTKKPPYGPGAIAMIVVTMIFVALVGFGTIVDVLIQYVPRFLACNKDSVLVNGDLDGDDEKTPLLSNQTLARNSDSVKPWDFVTAFSLFKTVSTLFATKQAPSVITSLNGLRVISMFWVILCHTYFWILTPGHVDNPIVMKGVLSRFSFQVVGNGFFSVDSFFFLSGVLVAYLSLREMEKKRGRFPFLHFYIHRYLRLTPVYAFVLFFTWALFIHLAEGPGFIAAGQATGGNCQKYWWTNLLYINNFYPWKSAEGSCIGWAWYLANDMQFYVISPFILIPMYMFFPAALVILGSLLLCSFIVTSALAGVYNYQANIFSALAYNYTMDPTGPQFNDLVYRKPWSRIQPYLVGLFLGYILYKKFQFRFGKKVNIIVYFFLWVAAGVIMIPDLYGLYFTYHGHVPGKAENVLYIGFGRFAWGVGLAIIVFACHNGYGWIINSFLSMKMWTPLARMTYNAYLIHPVVLSVVYGQMQKSFHYTDITISVFTVCFVVLSYGMAGVLCVLVEFPLATIEMLLFKLVGVKGRESQRQDVVEISTKSGNRPVLPSAKLFTKTIA